MSALLLCVASALIAPVAATPVHAPSAAQGTVERYEYWLYPPGIAPGGRQRWGVITGPSQEEAKQELERRQASQRKWWSWVGARNDAGDEPFTYDNFMGPIEVKPGGPRIPNGITTTNVWIVSLEEVAARRRVAAELADLRMRLEAAKDQLDVLLPIGTNTRSAADLRGRALFMASPLADSMAKVREAEAVLQASQGYTLADLMYQVDEVTVALRRLVPNAMPAEGTATPTVTETPTTVTTPPTTTPTTSGGATLLVPIVPPGSQPATPPGQGNPPARILEPGGTQAPTPGVTSAGAEATKQVIAELNRRLGAPMAGKANDDQLAAYLFDREGVTIRRQVYTNGRFAPAPPERIQYAAMNDPAQLFIYKGDRQSVAYGDPDITKFKFKPIVFLPVGTTPEQATQILEMVRHVVSPDTVPANPSVIGFMPSAPSEQEANAKMDAVLADVRPPRQIQGADFVPTVLPDWLKNDILGRVAFVSDAKTLATQYSGKLAEGAQVLDDQERPVTLEQLSTAITGEQWRAGASDRTAWTVTAYEERAGAVLVTLQASYVGRSATHATDRAVHGAKIHESWSVTPEGPVLNRLRLLRAGTVYRPTATTAADYATRHYDEATRLLADSRPQAAIAEFEAALRLNPENAMAWSQYGFTLFNVGQNMESLASYRLARDLDPKNATVIANYSAVLRSIGDLPTAIAAGKQAVEVDGASVWPREALALAHFEAKEYAAAAEQYAEAVKIAPADARLRANYASALFRAGKKKEAAVEAKTSYDAGFRGHWVFDQLGIRG
ncbi:MAG: tetratricopeptide repeat protein [Fimbriimonas sp.]